jgi:very-short-patch-repair endonuclease
MNRKENARRLRREQTPEERQLWRALRAGRFAGFKFRRQHPYVPYNLDFFCPSAKLAIELDGFGHGLPTTQKHDARRTEFLESHGVLTLRFWNHQWRDNRDGVLLAIWSVLHERTGCVTVERKIENRRFFPPKPDKIAGGSKR